MTYMKKMQFQPMVQAMSNGINDFVVAGFYIAGWKWKKGYRKEL